MYKLIRPLLFSLPPELAHTVTLKALKLYASFKKPVHNIKTTRLFNLDFPNPIGLAAGLDKNGDYIDALFSLGFGFIEVGTVTPRPQAGNPRPRLFRIPEAHAVINRMGFNNKGVDYLVERLKNRKVPGIVGVNIGKNKSTELHRAVEDYQICLEKVAHYADYITINISSPNTPGLRDLQHEDHLHNLLKTLNENRRKFNKSLPLLVKIAPDMTLEELRVIIAVAEAEAIDGLIIANTSVDHSSVSQYLKQPEAGGLSGAPIFERATELLREARALTELPIIGVGGIDSRERARQKLSAGASLIQLYTGLVYQGPGFVRNLLTALDCL